MCKKSEVSRSVARFSNYDTFAKRSPRFTPLTTVRESGCRRESKLDGNAEFDLRFPRIWLAVNSL